MKDSTETVAGQTTWPSLVGSILPKYGDPSWYFSFLLLAIVACVGLWRFVEVKFGGERKRSRPVDPPTESIPVRKAPSAPSQPVGCDEHARRIKDLEDGLAAAYDTFNERLVAQERAIRSALSEGLATAREEQDRRTRELREDLKEDMDRLETRVVNTVADKLSSFQTGLLSQIQTMFREGQDGLRVSGKIPH